MQGVRDAVLWSAAAGLNGAMPRAPLPALQVQDVAALLAAGPPGSFAAGLVASGTVSVDAGDSNFTCSIGTSGGAACACSPPALACTQQVACFGSLCDYSAQALAPNATYKVRALHSTAHIKQIRARTALTHAAAANARCCCCQSA